MKYVLTTLFVFFAIILGAQTQKKEHYKIHKLGASVDVSKYEKAVSSCNLDTYRFYDQRRTIRFTDGKAAIELFSAKELLDLFGKQIAPGTIMDPSKAREITFDISMDGNSLKPQIVK